jgi:glycerol-3-phosphate dehydrogenase
MGRCQRNWCGPKLMDIMARELGVSSEELTFKGAEFPLLTT